MAFVNESMFTGEEYVQNFDDVKNGMTVAFQKLWKPKKSDFFFEVADSGLLPDMVAKYKDLYDSEDGYLFRDIVEREYRKFRHTKRSLKTAKVLLVSNKKSGDKSLHFFINLIAQQDGQEAFVMTDEYYDSL